MSPNATLDARGLVCPIPSVKTQLRLEDLESGQILEVLADDPVTKTDLPRWVQMNGHTLLEIKDEAGFARIVIQKG